MGATIFDGPSIEYGVMGYILPGQLSPGEPLPDPNIDAGPGITYQGDSIPDVRYTFLKDKVQGFNGVVPCALNLTYLQSVEQIPAAAATANIAALANAVSGTPMTLVSAQSTGVTPAVPIIPWVSGAGPNNELNASAPVTVIALDFGFAFANCTSGSATIVVADTTRFLVGMPLCIAGVGNSTGTAALLTNVASIVDATHITVLSAPQFTNATAPIGAGNIWGFKEGIGYPTPTAAMPVLAGGPGLFLDPAGAVARCVSITGSTSGTGGNFLVSGYDIYGQPMTNLIAAGAGAVTTKGTKAFKYIVSVTPQFSDAHAYSVGTTDTFGFHYRSDKWEYTNIFFNGVFGVGSAGTQGQPGWTAAVLTSPATSSTGDVRGTIDVTSATGFNSASNGTIVSLAMSGRRLAIFQSMPLYNMIFATPFNPAPMFGVQQA